jgi:hypothetical protein
MNAESFLREWAVSLCMESHPALGAARCGGDALREEYGQYARSLPLRAIARDDTELAVLLDRLDVHRTPEVACEVANHVARLAPRSAGWQRIVDEYVGATS